MFSFHIHMERIHMGLRERYTGLCFVGGEAQSWVEIVYILSSFLSPHLLRGYDVYEDNAEVFSVEDGYCSTVYGFQWERVFEENFTGSVGKDEEVTGSQILQLVRDRFLLEVGKFFEYRFVSIADLSIRIEIYG